MSDSKSIRDATRNGWNSRRLVYRALENNDADQTFYHNFIAGDPIGLPLAYDAFYRPQSKDMSSEIITLLRKKLLCLVVCLPTKPEVASSNDVADTDATTTTTTGNQDTKASNTNNSNIPPTEPSSNKDTPNHLTPIGVLTLTAPQPDEHQHRNTNLGITIVDTYQGQGYGPEAINWALDWAFRFGGMHRVGLVAYGYNDRALRLYEKLGFLKEGVIREKLWFDRAWWDEVHFGMLEGEWEKLRDGQEQGKGGS